MMSLNETDRLPIAQFLLEPRRPDGVSEDQRQERGSMLAAKFLDLRAMFQCGLKIHDRSGPRWQTWRWVVVAVTRRARIARAAGRTVAAHARRFRRQEYIGGIPARLCGVAQFAIQR